MKKSKMILTGVVIATAFLTMGCGADSKLEKGIGYLNEGKYEEASNLFEEILKKDPDNEKAKNLEGILEDYKKAQEEYDKGNLEEAKKVLDEIPENYTELNIKENIDELKKTVDSKIKEIELNNNTLNKIESLINTDKLTEASNEIKEVKEESFTKEQKESLTKLKENLVKKEEENKGKLEEEKKKEAEKKKKAEEERKRKEADAKKQANEVNLGNKNNTTSGGQAQKPATTSKKYVSKRLGLQMNIPASWEGYYEVHESDDGITFSYVNKSNPAVKGLICIIEKEKVEGYNFLDNKVAKVINGQKYFIGTTTDIGTNADQIDKNIYNHFKGLQKQIPSLASSLSSSK